MGDGGGPFRRACGAGRRDRLVRRRAPACDPGAQLLGALRLPLRDGARRRERALVERSRRHVLVPRDAARARARHPPDRDPDRRLRGLDLHPADRARPRHPVGVRRARRRLPRCGRHRRSRAARGSARGRGRAHGACAPARRSRLVARGGQRARRRAADVRRRLRRALPARPPWPRPRHGRGRARRDPALRHRRADRCGTLVGRRGRPHRAAPDDRARERNARRS